MNFRIHVRIADRPSGVLVLRLKVSLYSAQCFVHRLTKSSILKRPRDVRTLYTKLLIHSRRFTSIQRMDTEYFLTPRQRTALNNSIQLQFDNIRPDYTYGRRGNVMGSGECHNASEACLLRSTLPLSEDTYAYVRNTYAENAPDAPINTNVLR